MRWTKGVPSPLETSYYPEQSMYRIFSMFLLPLKLAAIDYVQAGKPACGS